MPYFIGKRSFIFRRIGGKVIKLFVSENKTKQWLPFSKKALTRTDRLIKKAKGIESKVVDAAKKYKGNDPSIKKLVTRTINQSKFHASAKDILIGAKGDALRLQKGKISESLRGMVGNKFSHLKAPKLGWYNYSVKLNKEEQIKAAKKLRTKLHAIRKLKRAK